jgi:hypothetical protein
MKNFLLGLLIFISFSAMAKDLFLNCSVVLFEKGLESERVEASFNIPKEDDGNYWMEAKVELSHRFIGSVVALKNPYQRSADNTGMRITVYDSLKDVELSFKTEGNNLNFDYSDKKLGWVDRSTNGYAGMCDIGEKKYNEPSAN